MFEKKNAQTQQDAGDRTLLSCGAADRIGKVFSKFSVDSGTCSTGTYLVTTVYRKAAGGSLEIF